MAKWTTSETGILRKKTQKDNFDDLLVFGYACKLFRDDEKASYIDKGRHLIPWMGDEKLRIDRYDGRGTLSELASCEASREGYDATRWLGLSESERKIEQLCDEERYYALHKNEDEEAMYREEELKRLQQKTNEFHFNYDVSNETENVESANEEKPPTVEEDDRPYVPPPELDVPADIMIPKTIKENARIMKTAQFISLQGSQMEILIKTKQADNPQFDFMNSTDPLFKYYRHVLQAIKNGRYKVETNDNSEQSMDDSAEQDSDEHYLHPSLLAPSTDPVPTATLTIPTVVYRPSADCHYSQLVNRIQGTQFVDKTDVPPPPPPPPNIYDQQQQQYYQYYYMLQCYEYYKQMLQYQSQNYPQAEDSPELQQIQEQLNYISQYLQQQHQQQQNPNNPYAQIVANLSQHVKDSACPLPLPPEPTPELSNDIAKAPVIYSKTVPEPENPSVIGPQLPEATNVPIQNEVVTVDKPKEPTPPTTIMESQPKAISNDKPLLSLVHYGSDSDMSPSSDEEEESKPEEVKIPPPDIQVIIDKMASYVSKNGGDFESIVKSKGDARFDFLHNTHEYHGYYKQKVAFFTDASAPEKAKKPQKDKNGMVAKREKKVIAPVSFSIKKAKEEPPKDIKSALPVEESDDETEENANSKDSKTTANATTFSMPMTGLPVPVVTPSLPLNISTMQYSIATAQMVNTVCAIKPAEVAEVAETVVSAPEEAIPKNGNSDNEDPILEMIDLTYELEERRDARRAEDKIKDKLAAAAREKLASVAKERALQIERRKKAAAFLKLKSGEVETIKIDEDTPNKEDSNGDGEIIEGAAQKRRRSRSRSRERHSKRKKSRKRSSERSSKYYRDDYRKRSRSRSQSYSSKRRDYESEFNRSTSRGKDYKSDRRNKDYRSSSKYKEYRSDSRGKEYRSHSRSMSRDVYSRSRSRSFVNSPRRNTKTRSEMKSIAENDEYRSNSLSPTTIERRRRSTTTDSNEVRVVSVYKLPDKDVTITSNLERLTEREIIIKDDESGTEEGEIRKHKKSSKKKKSHKRKSSKSRYESKSHHHKKSKKRRRSRSSSKSDSSS